MQHQILSQTAHKLGESF